MNLVSSCSIVASLFLALGAKPSWGQDDAEPDFRRPPPGEGLRVQALRLPTLPAESCTLIVVLGDLQHELELRRASVRSANFRLLVDSPDGLVPSEPPPITTYRGTVDGDPDSRVVASLVGGELEASILFGDGNLWQVTPARHLGTSIGRGLHAISALPTRLGPQHAGGTNLVGEPEIAQLGVDSEYRHTRWIGGVTQTLQRIENTVSSANLVYEEQLNVRFELSTVILRTNPNDDPYAAFETGGACTGLLQASGNVWSSTQAQSPWDMVVLYHHKPLSVGASCAEPSSLCKCGKGYAVIGGVDNVPPQGGFPYGFLHEVGHVFGSDDDACANPPGCSDCFIMGNCGQSQTHGEYCDCELAQMLPVVAAAPCLATVVASQAPTLSTPSNPSVMAPEGLVTLHGTNLADTQYIVFEDGSGPQTFRCLTEVIDDETLLVASPLPSTLGTFQLAVGNSAGRSNFVTLDYVHTTPPLLTAKKKVKTGSVSFPRQLYGPAGAHVKHIRSNGSDAKWEEQPGFLVLTQQDAVSTLVLNGVGQATQAGVTGNLPGVNGHIFCQFVVYSDATYTTIVAVSNVTDTLVIQ